MKKIQLTILITVFFAISSLLFAGGFALSGVGSRATSMAGAFRALSDDATAMYWNPAGLGFMEDNLVDLGGTFIMPSATWVNNGPYFANVPGYSNKEYEAVKSLRAFPNLFVTMAKNPKLKYGLGIYVPYGLGTTWDSYEQPAAYAGFTHFPEDEMLSSIAIVDIHPTAAYQITPCLSAGLGLSVMYGMIDINKIQFSAPPNFLPTTSELSGSGMGFGANFGFLLKPMSALSVGLSGKIPSKIDMKGDIEAYTWIPPSTKVGGKSDIDATLKLPGEIGLGVAYKVMPNWTLSLDYAYTMWNNLERVTVKLDDPITVSPVPGAPQLTQSELLFMWKDTSRFSLGTEYKMGVNAFRGGVYFDQSPIPEKTQIITLSDIGNKISGNLGYGRSFGSISLDLNVQYVSFTEREVETQGSSNMAGTYNSNSISGNIGLGYKF